MSVTDETAAHGPADGAAAALLIAPRCWTCRGRSRARARTPASPWHYGDPVREQRLLEAGEAAVDLSHRGVVTVTGPDRLSGSTP